jgi:endoglucanase
MKTYPFLPIALFLCFFLTMPPALCGPAGMVLEGVNISGAEWGQNIPGAFMVDYIFPTATELDYFKSKGMNVVRVPFMWERMQPAAYGPLDATYASRLDAVLSAATARGLHTVIDVHNYGAYRNLTIGVSGGHPNAVLTDLWTKLSQRYGTNANVVFGLMNEPVGSTMTAQTWCATAQACINAIRATGSTNLILVPSTYWDHANNFTDLNASAMINITDPANNFSYEVHQYLDYDGSGSHSDVLSVSDSVATLSKFTSWLLANHRTAFLGEIGVPASSVAQADLAAMLQYMHENKAAWTGFTYWSAGPWWQSYIFGVEPVNGNDTVQMTTLINNLGATQVATTPPPTTTDPGTGTGGTTPTDPGTTTGGTTTTKKKPPGQAKRK